MALAAELEMEKALHKCSGDLKLAACSSFLSSGFALLTSRALHEQKLSI